MKKFAKIALLTLSAALVVSAGAGRVTGADGVTVDVKNPQRVVVLNGTNVEMMYAFGKQNAIVGRDITGTYPPSAEKIPSVGHWAKASAEGIISLKPDLVVMNEDNMLGNKTLSKQLRDAGVKVLVMPHAMKGGTAGFEKRATMLSEVLDVPNEGKKMIAKFRKELKEAEKTKFNKKPLKVLFIYSHGPSDTSIYGANNGADTLIKLAGGTNMASFTDKLSTKITAEQLVRYNPDVIIMLDRGLKAVNGVDGLLKLPGVAQTTAGKNRSIYITDNSIRWVGPRLPEFIKKLSGEWKADFR